MNKYITKSEYYNVETGLEITKNIAKRDFIILKKWKTVKIEDETKARGYEYKKIIIIYINECQKSKQLELYENTKS